MAARSAPKRQSTIEPLQLGTITETWQNRSQWSRFSAYLDTMDEGCDSEGVPMSLGRYARFLELYAALHRAEFTELRPREDLKKMVLAIKTDKEDFFGRERCLKCIDAGMRKQILESVKQVNAGEIEPSVQTYQPAYDRVLGKLNELLGSFQDVSGDTVPVPSSASKDPQADSGGPSKPSSGPPSGQSVTWAHGSDVRNNNNSKKKRCVIG